MPSRSRKVHLLWNRSALDQHWDYRNVPVKGGCDFQTHEIIGIIEAPCAGLVGRFQPLVSDDREQHMALVNTLLDCIPEIGSELDRVDVLKQMLLAKGCFQVIENPARNIRRILASIRDKDVSH